MKKKAVLSTAVLSLGVVGLLSLQIAYASPYMDISVDRAYDMITSGLYPDLVVLDVRTKIEYDSGHIYGAVWIPVSELVARIGELAGHENHKIIVYCGSGVRSVTASGILDSCGFTKVYNMLGGISAWRSAGYPVWIATVHNVNTTLNYDTIQAAIDAPQTLDGHTILVDAGTYYEHVVVDKTVSLIGENTSTTIIDGNGTEIVVHSITSNVEIRGFTVQNGGGYPYSSILLGHCVGNTIQDNVIRNSDLGIALHVSNGCIIVGNKIMNNYAGIVIRDGSNNEFHYNMIANNSMGVWITSESSLFNTLYHNNFINNINQVSHFGSGTIWDDGYPSGGNYWSDHVCTGNPSDGSQPCIIDENNIDHYPFQDPNGWLLPHAYVFEIVWDSEVFYVSVESNSTVSNLYFNQPMKEIGFNVTGPDGTIGFCNVTIPKQLLDGEPWIVLIDAQPVTYIQIENETHNLLWFTYTHSIHEVRIIGTHVIGPPPEYTLTIYSSPTGVTFTVDGVSRTTPWSGTYSESASVSLVMPEIHSVGDARYYWNQWSDGNTSRSRTITMNTDITLTAHYTGPYYQLTVTSSPITGITFTINGAPQTTPYTKWLLEGSYTLEMPQTHNGYVWSHWLEDGDTNRIKTITLQGTTWTAVYEPAPPSPVGGKATPINKVTIKPESLVPYIGLTILLAVAVITVGYVKKRKRNKEINS